MIFHMEKHEMTPRSQSGWYSGGVPDASTAWVDAAIERPSGRNLLGSLGVDGTKPGSREFRVYKRLWDVQSKKVRRVWHDLRPNDVVQMIPRANYPGWTCLVREASIKITYDASPKDETQTADETTLSPRRRTFPLIYPTRLDSENHQVRMLVVEPAVAADEPIVCSLITTHLPSAQSFDALSYCWGAVSSMDILNVNGQDISVSSSVTAALRRLRHETHELAIWIDQICINQPDKDERNEQVRLMAEIYSSAAQVHVWLGEGDVATWTALRIIRDSFNMNHQVCPGGAACKCYGTTHTLEVESFKSRHRQGEPSFKFMHEVFFTHVKNEHGELANAAGMVNNLQLTTLMSTLYINPWFRRVWVLQEALLAEEALVHCGKEIVPWKEVQRVSNWLSKIHQPFYHVPHITMPNIWGLLRSNNGQVQELALLDVFIHGLEMKATDHRDKLFALLSFARGTARGTKVPLAIRSSYAKDPKQVFADFTIWWIHEHQSLSILSLIHSHRDRTWQRLRCGSVKPQLESPTWAVVSEGQAKWARMTLDAQFDFCASADTVPDKELLHQALLEPTLKLQLRGFELTTIKDIVHLSLAQSSEPLTKSAKELLEVFDLLFDPCGRHRTWNSKFKGLNWSRSPFVGADRLRQELFDHVNTHSSWKQQEPQRALQLPRGVPENMTADRQIVITSTGLPACLDPFLFVAENGSIGICPWMAEKGDAVVILCGGKVPYLLRPNRNVDVEADEVSFQLIGECYVMDAMDGIWFRRQLEQGLKPRTFGII